MVSTPFQKIFGWNPVLLAPMFEVTNLPFRLLSRRYGASGGITEFISANQILYVYSNKLQEENPLKFMMKTDESEKPVGLQFFGYSEETFLQLSEVFEPQEAGFDFIDLNIGCPVPKICQTGSGARLLASENLIRLESILKTISNSFPETPFSIKIRSGYKKQVEINKVAELINSLNLLMVTIHPKLAVPPNSNNNSPDHDFTKDLAAQLDHPVIVNGGITSLDEAKKLQEKTKSKGVMIGRKAMNYPYIFRPSYQSSIPRKEYLNGLLTLLSLYDCHGLNEKSGFTKLYIIRDQISNQIRGFKGSKIKRTELQCKLHSIDQLYAFVENLELYFSENSINEIPA